VFALAGRIQADLDNLKEDDRAHLKLPMVLNKWGLGPGGKTGFADPRSYKREIQPQT
jgi:hypothetical protein